MIHDNLPVVLPVLVPVESNSATVSKNNERFIQLVARLEQIRTAVRPHDAEKAMQAFTFELLRLPARQQVIYSSQQIPDVLIFNSTDDDLLLDQLEYHGAAIATILNAMDRFLNRRVSPEFFNCATIALIHLTYHSPRRCRAIYQQGGMTEISRMMEMYRSVDYVQIIGIAALMVIGKVVLGESTSTDAPTRKNMVVESMILLQILEAMECHQESPRVYVVACSAFGTLFGPGSKIFIDGGELENHIYHRALYAITYGLILHMDDTVAQGVGNALLGTMVGQDVAQEMISEVEMNHGGITCAAAA